ncbi:TolC family protein [Allomuricauda sp. AC10]|nr:TolC family protein [Muricauda sp. AC10]MDC6365637.1 TolC family protein [Muricauda sp. AC10]
MVKRFGLILAIIVIANLSHAQSIDDFIKKGLEKNDISKSLPPLDSLIEIAKDNSPRLKFFDADHEYWSGNITLAKRDWLRNINLEAGYGYGIFDNLSNQQIAGDPGSQTLFSTEQSRYTVGVSLKMPLASIFNRNRNIKNAKAEADKSKYNKEYAMWELEQLIVRQYNDLLKAHRLFFISNTIVETYKVQSLRAEKDFTNGIINVAEYTRLQQMLNQAISSYESQRAEFLIALKSLEGTVGIEIPI